MRVKDLMRQDVLTFRAEESVDKVVDVLVDRRLHGAPVVGEQGELLGVVSQWDIYFSTMTRQVDSEAAAAEPAGNLTVGDIMTSPAVSAGEDTEVRDLCRMMCRLRLHRVPIVREQKVVGIVSALDVCRAVSEGRLD